MAVTLRFQSSGTVPGGAQPVPMLGGSLTIGRGPANDLVLPDPDRVLSKSHCVLEDHNGKIVVVDLSTNGTFLNYAKIPLGRSPTPINDGDVLCIGPYELVVDLNAEVVPADAPLPNVATPIPAVEPVPLDDPLSILDGPGGGTDVLDELLGTGPVPTGPSQLNTVDPIDELLPPEGEEDDPFFTKPDDGREGDGASFGMHNPSAQDNIALQAPQSQEIPEDWDDLLAPDPPESQQPPPPVAQPAPPPPQQPAPQPIPAAPAPQPQPQPVAAPPPAAAPEPIFEAEVTVPPAAAAPEAPAAAPAPAPAPTPVAAAQPSDAARAFLAAVGADEVSIDDAELTSTMSRMGRIMRTFVTGLREVLMTRTSIKSEFRIEQTMIGAGGNNPLKFSISPDQAIEAMVRPTTKGYLSPETAAEEALEDIKAHEIAMVTGMEAALKGVLARLDPQELTGKIEASGALGGLFKGKKARYWEVYEKMYAEISDQAENDFHDLFSREFARAYKEQLDKLKTK